MKLLHISDLHIGKRVNEFSMIEDQKYILLQILSIIDQEKPDAVLIAGDVYDKTVPSAEAVQVLDDFLVRLSKRETKVFMISGNHDSPERLAFGGRILGQRGIYISPVYHKEIEKISLTDEHGMVNFYLLPFIKPIHVRSQFPDLEIKDYSEAMKVAIEEMNVDKRERNVLVTHQFVTGASTCESEELSVGGSDQVSADVFEDFDYVALGHLHGPQSVKRETIRYSGTPLKYSFSEKHHQKSVTIVEVGEKGKIDLRLIPLEAMRDMCERKGSYLELAARTEEYEERKKHYVHLILTDEEDVPDALGKLRILYPYIMKLSYDNRRTRQQVEVMEHAKVEQKSPMELFEELYFMQNNSACSKEQRDYMEQVIESIWEER